MPTVFSITDKYTSLLMHMDGVNNGGVFPEETGKTVTRVGAPVTSNAQSVFGNSSLTGLATNKYIAIDDHDDFDFGQNDFTIEAWIYRTNASGYQAIVVKRENWNEQHSFTFTMTGNILRFECGIPSQIYGNFNGLSFSLNTWIHTAVVREGTKIYGYSNGIKSTNYITISAYSIARSPVPIWVGVSRNLTPVDPFVGYIDEVRISKGIARYTSNFTPPTEPFMR
jgi:hypothetical protein